MGNCCRQTRSRKRGYDLLCEPANAFELQVVCGGVRRMHDIYNVIYGDRRHVKYLHPPPRPPVSLRAMTYCVNLLDSGLQLNYHVSVH